MNNSKENTECLCWTTKLCYNLAESNIWVFVLKTHISSNDTGNRGRPVCWSSFAIHSTNYPRRKFLPSKDFHLCVNVSLRGELRPNLEYGNFVCFPCLRNLDEFGEACHWASGAYSDLRGETLGHKFLHFHSLIQLRIFHLSNFLSKNNFHDSLRCSNP